MATDIERFMEKVEVSDNGCWLWTAGKSVGGYGRFTVREDGKKRLAMAHRWAYEHFIGPIPTGLTVDHLCHNRDMACNAGNACLHRSCVNPEHLEATSQRTNILRGHGLAAANAKATHCVKGHPLAGENLLIESGRRRCRICRRERVANWQKSDLGRANEKRYRQTPQRQAYIENYKAEHAEEMREYQQRYYQEHREHVLELQKKRAATDSTWAERQAIYRRRHYEKNAEEIRAKRRARRAANLEVERARDREYQRRKRERKKQADASA